MNLFANHPGGGVGGAALTARGTGSWLRGRPSRAFLLAAVLVTLGVLAACGNGSFLSVRDSTALAATSRTVSGLDQVGYRDAGIHLESGSGLPADGLVDVSYSVGPAADAQANIRDADRIVWTTLGYRFGAVAVSQTSGGCAPGQFCASSSTQLGSQTYAQLRGEFGSRPAGLDKTSVSQTALMPPWLPGVLSVLVVGIAVAVIYASRRRSRDPAGDGAWR